MLKMKNIYFVILVLIGLQVSAQQEPQYTQYMYNMSAINPAYAGSTDNMTFGFIYRDQWTGLNGAPKTLSFFGNAPIGEKVGLGLSVITDKIGPVSETSLTSDFSYTLKLNGKQRLAFGLKAGAIFHSIGLANVDVMREDPLYSQNVTGTNANLGAGLFYYSDRYYIAASVPNLLENSYYDIEGVEVGGNYRHYYLTGGYIFNLSDVVKLKPSFLVKSAFEAPVSFDINTNVLIYDRLELGVSYRLDDSVSGLINFACTPNLRIGYAYDAITSSIHKYAPASHEFLVLFDFKLSNRESKSPRFF